MNLDEIDELLKKVNTEYKSDDQTESDSKDTMKHEHPGESQDVFGIVGNSRNKVLKILLIVAIIVAIPVIAILVLNQMGKIHLKNSSKYKKPKLSESDIVYDADSVYYKGQKYKYNEDIVTILCMGIDKDKDSDGNFLLMIDTNSKRVNVMTLNRDAITAVKAYDMNGNYIGTSDMQLTLAYAYGDGKEKSCELMKEAVADMLYQLPIHGYVSLDMKCVMRLNNMVGKVTLEPIETLDSKIIEGQRITLTGRQALKYVRERDSKSGELGTNSKRIERQKQYLTLWYEKAMNKYSDDGAFVKEIYKASKKYMRSDIDVDEAIYLYGIIKDANLKLDNIIDIPGEYQHGEYFDEYIIDKERLTEMIIEYFYIKVD